MKKSTPYSIASLFNEIQDGLVSSGRRSKKPHSVNVMVSNSLSKGTPAVTVRFAYGLTVTSDIASVTLGGLFGSQT